MPPKQQTLSFGNINQGESSSSRVPEKRPRQESPDRDDPTPPPTKLSFFPPRVLPREKEDFSYSTNYHRDAGLPTLQGPNSIGTRSMMAQIYTNNYNSQLLHDSLTAQLQSIHGLLALQTSQFQERFTKQETHIAELQKQLQLLVSRPTPPPIFPVATTVSSLPVTQPPPQQKPTPLNAKAQQFHPGTATTTTTATSTPKPRPTPATEARDDADAGFKKVTNKKQQRKKKKETLLPQPLPIADRKLIFQLTSGTTTPPPTAASNALRLINKTINEHPDITHPPCPTAYITNSNTLVVLVADRYTAAAYNPYIGILQEALRSNDFPIASACISERRSRFVLHGVPTNASFEEVRHEIESLYPELRLAQLPRWLSTPEQRHGKTASSMVIALTGQHTLKSIGRFRLDLFNNHCNLDDYLSFGSRTRCGKCQLYGHPTNRCKAPLPACAVCAQGHNTHEHPCSIPSCKKGHACTHPPIMCVSCQQPHKATDPTCPTFIKLRAQAQEEAQEEEVEVTMTE
jgi:hypothetical protein